MPLTLLKNQLQKKWIFCAGLLGLMLLNGCTQARTLAFPEADGYGRFAKGGRGGDVYVVTSLEDSRRDPAPGTLRHAVEAKGPRTVVFAVSGIINLDGDLNIRNGNITIAGQTSPGGIVLRGAATLVRADDVIIRYMRFRYNDEDTVGAYKVRNVIFDHCSMSWSVDEVASFYHNVHFTLQYSIIAQALNRASHSDGDHGFGGIWGGAGVSFHHNLLAHNAGRNPRINGYRMRPPYEKKLELVDLRNNVIYNWEWLSAYGSEEGQFNLINSYYRTGPATKNYATKTIFKFYPNKRNGAFGRGYIDGNIMDHLTVKHLHGDEGIALLKGGDKVKPLADRAFDESDVAWFDEPSYRQTHTAEQAYALLIKQREVGANRNAFGFYLDWVDREIIDDVAKRKAVHGNGIIDSIKQVIPDWETYGKSLGGAPGRTAPTDTDKDGMPDQWERKKKVQDPNGFDLDKNYTNLEVYLNALGAFHTSLSSGAGTVSSTGARPGQ